MDKYQWPKEWITIQECAEQIAQDYTAPYTLMTIGLARLRQPIWFVPYLPTKGG